MCSFCRCSWEEEDPFQPEAQEKECTLDYVSCSSSKCTFKCMKFLSMYFLLIFFCSSSKSCLTQLLCGKG